MNKNILYLQLNLITIFLMSIYHRMPARNDWYELVAILFIFISIAAILAIQFFDE